MCLYAGEATSYLKDEIVKIVTGMSSEEEDFRGKKDACERRGKKAACEKRNSNDLEQALAQNKITTKVEDNDSE